MNFSLSSMSWLIQDWPWMMDSWTQTLGSKIAIVWSCRYIFQSLIFGESIRSIFVAGDKALEFLSGKQARNARKSSSSLRALCWNILPYPHETRRWRSAFCFRCYLSFGEGKCLIPDSPWMKYHEMFWLIRHVDGSHLSPQSFLP